MNEFLKIAVEAATKAGDYIRQSANEIDSLKVAEKSVHDYVSEVDRHAEVIITTLLAKHFPSHRVLGEEHGQTGNAGGEYQWVIDPLDGTTNFLRSIPHYAVSIALVHKNTVVVGVVYDVAKDELFYASKGQGAFVNGIEITVSQRNAFKGALLATGVPFNGKNLDQISSFTTTMEGLLALQTSGIRRLGAAALDLAYIACGRYDGFWEANLQSWDIAAGVLLVKEAGGVVTDLRGGDEYLTSGNILAACESVHETMLAVTTSAYGN